MIACVNTCFQTHQLVYINYIQIFLYVEKKGLLLADYFAITSAVVGNIWIKFSKLPWHCIAGLYGGGACLTRSETEARKKKHYILPIPLFHDENSHHYWNCHQALFQGLVDFSGKSGVLSGIPFWDSKFPKYSGQHKDNTLNISMRGWYWISFACIFK